MNSHVGTALFETALALVPIAAALVARARLFWLVLAAVSGVAWLAAGTLLHFVHLAWGAGDARLLVLWSAVLLVAIVAGAVWGSKRCEYRRK